MSEGLSVGGAWMQGLVGGGRGGDAITKNSQAREHIVSLGFRNLRQRTRARLLAFGRPEHVLV